MRCHVLPLVSKTLEATDVLLPVSVLSVAPIEIFASKIVALLTRAAARDLYDVNNMASLELVNESEKIMLRKCVVFYYAIGNEEEFAEFNISRIDSITPYKIRTDLKPVLHKLDRFDLPAAQMRVKEFPSGLLVLEDEECHFLDSFRQGEYKPEFLFEGDMLNRVKNHPMVRWKLR